MNLALRRMRASDDEALSLRGELGNAKDDLAAGRSAFGEHHLTISVRGSDIDLVDAQVAEVQSALTDLGLIAVREEIGLEAAWWAQFPGVRRRDIWHRSGRGLAESEPRLGVDVRRRACGEASGDIRWFFA